MMRDVITCDNCMHLKQQNIVYGYECLLGVNCCGPDCYCSKAEKRIIKPKTDCPCNKCSAETRQSCCGCPEWKEWKKMS